MREVIEFSGTEPLTTMQSFYIADRRIGLKPNLIVIKNGRPWFETNSWGLKGPEPRLDKKLVVVWGDSVVFGIGSPTWVDLLNQHFEQYHFLNGGIEGNTVDHILERAIAFNRARQIDTNVVFPGWHPSSLAGPVNTTFEKVLREGLEQLPNCMLVTVPTALNERVVGVDLSPYAVDSDGLVRFTGWAQSLAPATLQSVYMRVVERNEIIERVAKQKSVPLINWFARMRTSSLEDFHTDFFDFGHPRPASYGKIARIWKEALQPHL